MFTVWIPVAYGPQSTFEIRGTLMALILDGETGGFALTRMLGTPHETIHSEPLATYPQEEGLFDVSLGPGVTVTKDKGAGKPIVISVVGMLAHLLPLPILGIQHTCFRWDGYAWLERVAATPRKARVAQQYIEERCRARALAE